MCGLSDTMYGKRADMTGGLCHASAIKLAAQHRSFVAKNFKQYLVICLLAVKNICEVKKVISNA